MPALRRYVNFDQEVNPSEIDLGVLPQGTTNPVAETLIPREVFFYRFELTESVDTAQGDYFVIDTLGSVLTDGGFGVNDTEIGLYDSAENLVASNDDFDFTAGVDHESRLAFGADPLAASSGDLAAGEYFLAVGAFNTSFGFVAFDASSVSAAVGTAQANFNLFINPSTFQQADFDEDGDVDGDDFLRWQAGFPTASGASHIDGDADGDGDVDGDDFLIWQTQFAPGGGSGAIGHFLPGATNQVDVALQPIDLALTASQQIAVGPGHNQRGRAPQLFIGPLNRCAIDDHFELSYRLENDLRRELPNASSPTSTNHARPVPGPWMEELESLAVSKSLAPDDAVIKDLEFAATLDVIFHDREKWRE